MYRVGFVEEFEFRSPRKDRQWAWDMFPICLKEAYVAFIVSRVSEARDGTDVVLSPDSPEDRGDTSCMVAPMLVLAGFALAEGNTVACNRRSPAPTLTRHQRCFPLRL
jgi:hypothetical protein